MPQLLSSLNLVGGKKLRSQIFTSSGTWYNPGVDIIEVLLVAGGGAGYRSTYSGTSGGNSTFGSLLLARGGVAGTSGLEGKGGGKVLVGDAQRSVGGSCSGGDGGSYNTTYPQHIPGYAFHEPVLWNNGGCSYGKGALGDATTDAEVNGGGGGACNTVTTSATGGGGEIVFRSLIVSGIASVDITIGAGGDNSYASWMCGADGRCEVYWWG
jgi:hypothetical protein